MIYSKSCGFLQVQLAAAAWSNVSVAASGLLGNSSYFSQNYCAKWNWQRKGLNIYENCESWSYLKICFESGLGLY